MTTNSEERNRPRLGVWGRILGGLVLLLALNAPVYAGGITPKAAAAAAAARVESSDAMLAKVGFSINAILAHIRAVSIQIAKRYHQTALTQVTIIMTIMVSLLGLRIAFDTMGGLSGTFRAVGELLMIWGLVMWTLNDYSQMTGWITNGFTEAANILMGANPAHPEGMSWWNSKGYLIAVNLIAQIAHLPWMAGGIFSGAFLVSIVDSLVAAVIYILVAAIAVVATTIYVAFYFLSNVYINLAIAVGPVFLPWALIPWTRRYAANWVHFLIQGGMYHLIGPVMLIMVADVMNKTSSAGNIITTVMPGGAAVLNVPGMIIYVMYSVLEVYLMLQIPVIVQSLSAGFFGSSLTSGPMSALTGKLGKGKG